jgi:hypothetical protein
MSPLATHRPVVSSQKLLAHSLSALQPRHVFVLVSQTGAAAVVQSMSCTHSTHAPALLQWGAPLCIEQSGSPVHRPQAPSEQVG